MPKIFLAAILVVSCLGLSGCLNDTVQRLDGVTPAAGDAIAANTVMQMVDPWQYGVQDTDLEVPADRGVAAEAAAADDSDASSSDSSATTGSSN